MTEVEKAALIARLDKIASVGATVLSNASYAKKAVEQIQTTDPQPTGALIVG